MTQQVNNNLMQKLMLEEEAQQNLARAQLDSLLLKKKQLQVMTEKLRALEGRQTDTKSLQMESAEYTIFTTGAAAVAAESNSEVAEFQDAQVTDMRDAEVTDLSLMMGSEEMMEMLADPEFQEKIMKLREQEVELKYLEEQLSSLKEIKMKLANKHEIMQDAAGVTSGSLSIENTEAAEQDEVATNNQLEQLTTKELRESLDATTKELATTKNESAELETEHKELIDSLEQMANELESLERKQQEIMTFTHQKPDIKQVVDAPNAEDESINDLMERLMNASVGELQAGFDKVIPLAQNTKTLEANSTSNAEAPESTEPQVDEDEERDALESQDMAASLESQSSIAETSQKIQTAKQMILSQLAQLEANEQNIKTNEDEQYYLTVHNKLTTQLDELLQAEEKIDMYTKLLSEYQIVSAEQEDELEEFASREITPQAISSKQKYAEDAAQEELDSEISESLPAETEFIDAIQNDSLDAATGALKKYSSFDVSLCNEQKERVIRAGTIAIDSFSSNPAFLLSLFKALPKFRNSVYAQQKLMCVIDELEDAVEEIDLDDYMSEVSVEATKEIEAEDIDSIRSRIHLSTFKFIDALLSDAEYITHENTQQLCHHINSMMYSHLISHSSNHAIEGMHPSEAAQIMSNSAPLMARLVGSYVDQESRMGPMLAYDINRVFDSVFGWADNEEEESESESEEEDAMEEGIEEEETMA